MKDNQKLLENAVASLAAGRKETARRLLSSAVAREPENQEAWLYLAVALPPDKSEQALQKVLALNPEHEVARCLLGKMQATPGLKLHLDDLLPTQVETDTVAVEAAQVSPPIEKPKRARKPRKTTHAPTEALPETLESQPTPAIEVVENSPEVIEPISGVAVPAENSIPEAAEQPPASESEAALEGKPLPSQIDLPEVEVAKAHTYQPERVVGQSVSGSKSFESKPPPAEFLGANLDIWSRAAAHRNATAYARGQGKLKDRPVRRTRGPSRSFVSLTNFGLIILVALLVLLVGYFFFVYIRP